MDKRNIELSKIILGVVNANSNEYLLKSVPHHEFLDLAIVYYSFDKKENGEYERSIITKEEFVSIVLPENEVYHLALENTFTLCPLVIKPMFDEVELKMMSLYKGIPEGSDQELELQMVLVTNQMHIGGAAALLALGPFHTIAEYLKDDIYILPSSVDELLVVGCKGHDAKELIKSVREINQSLVEPEQVLSDSIYLIKRGEPRIGQLSIKDL